MPRFAVTRLRKTHSAWTDSKNDATLLPAVTSLATDYAKDNAAGDAGQAELRREDLDLVCFEYVSS